MRHLLLIWMLPALFACEKEPGKLGNGSYMGTFKYDTLQLWESFGISNNRFEEYASGGVFQQKFPIYCLTKGTFKIQNGNIYFNNVQIAQPPNKDITDCDQDYLLMGAYNIEEINDSTISFRRYSELGKQEYKMKFYYFD